MSVGPSLHPRMVVVGMGPTRRIDLAGRNADGTQGSHGKGALLATTARGGTHGSHRSGRAGVGRLIGHMLMAPMVDLEDGLLHAQPLDAVLQFVIIDDTEAVQILVVDTNGKDEMAKLALRHLATPYHLLTRLERLAHVGKEEVGRIIRLVGHRHVGIEKLQSLGLHAIGSQPFDVEAILAHEFHARVEGLHHLLPILVVLQEMSAPLRLCAKRQEKAEEKKCFSHYF